MSILKEHESIRFNEIKPNFLSEGRQSRVSLLEYESKNQKNKVIWKRMGANKKLTDQEAGLIKAELLPYKNSLRQYGWSTPNIYHLQIVDTGDEHQIFSYEEPVGRGDGEKIIGDSKEPNFKKWFIIRSVCEQLANYPANSLRRKSILGKKLTQLPHGLDLKLANVVSTDDRGLFFVDLFGPKLLNEKGSWRFYSDKLDTLKEEKLLAVCASREGSLLRFLRLTEWQWQKAGNYPPGAVRNGIMEIIKNSNLKVEENDFILSQIKDNYSWLDQIYKENQV